MPFDRRRFMQVGAAAAAGTLVPLLSRAQGSGPIKIGASRDLVRRMPANAK